MSTKTYTTTHGSLSFPLTVEGRHIRIRFTSKDNQHGYYLCSNPAIQEALEATRDFNTTYTLHTNATEAISPIEKLGQKGQLIEVKTWQEAANILRCPPYNIPYRRVQRSKEILKEATLVGIEFTITSNK